MQAKPVAKKAKVEAAPAAATNGGDPESCTVFVGNMSWNSDDSSITEHFKGCGKIAGIRVGEWWWGGGGGAVGGEGCGAVGCGGCNGMWAALACGQLLGGRVHCAWWQWQWQWWQW